MSKTDVTKLLEKKLFYYTDKMNTYICFEVKINEINEIVDMISLDTNGVWRFYEIKQSKNDFYSKSAKTFLGNYNYYMMPTTLYEEVKQDIPKEIGVIVLNTSNIWNSARLVKNPKRLELGIDETILHKSMIKSLSREVKKKLNDYYFEKDREMIERMNDEGWY